MDADTRIISTTEELKVFSDPFRLSILHVFREHKEPMTVTQCAEVLGEFPSKVLYHVKKLLSIDVLALDHIEVVNGINAKFYKLTKSKFSVSIKEDTEDVVKKNIQLVNNITISQMEQFKTDFITMSHMALKKRTGERHDVGWFSYNKVNLTKEQFYDLEKLMIDFIEKNTEKAEDKNEYTVAFGIARKFKE